MEVEKILKSTQEQAAAAWITSLNQQRIDELLKALQARNITLEQTLSELQKLKVFIGDPSHILGSKTTKHGEIAENAQVYISNARRLIDGLSKQYSFEGVGRTAPEDYLKDGLPVQSKFLNGLKATLNGNGGANGIRQHIQKYPDFVKSGGSYDIPEDQYSEMMRLLSLREKTPSVLTKGELKILNEIDSFEKDTGLSVRKDIHPSVMKYSAVQQGKIVDTIKEEETSLRKTDQWHRDEAYQESKPSLKEGVTVAVVSAMMEGGTRFCLTVAKKLKEGKKIHEFTAEDWSEAGIEATKGGAVGAVRGGSIYVMTNFTATPAPVANALVTAAVGITSLADRLRIGEISEEDFLIDSEIVCLDVSVSAIASILGQVVIPIPVLGTLVGNTVGMFLYELSKDALNQHEQRLIDSYSTQISELNAKLDIEHMELLKQLLKEFERFSSALELAFDENINIAFAGSINLALQVGVSSGAVLKNKTEIDNFFEA